MGAQNTNCTMKFIDIPEERQREAINTVALQTGLPPSSIEKDWWVTQVLKALHTLPAENSLALAVNCRRLKSATGCVALPVLS